MSDGDAYLLKCLSSLNQVVNTDLDNVSTLKIADSRMTWNDHFGSFNP